MSAATRSAAAAAVPAAAHRALVEAPQSVIVDAAFALAQRRWNPQQNLQGKVERAKGLCLNADGAWEKYPSVLGEAAPEILESEIPATFNEHCQDGTIVRTLTNFALYGPDGRMVGVEALELPNFEVTLYGTLAVPLPPDLAGPLFPPYPPRNRQFANPSIHAVFNGPSPTEILESSREPAQPAQAGEADSSDAAAASAAPVVESDYAKARRSIVTLLDNLLTMPVSKDAIKDTGIGKSVNKLKDHFDPDIARRSKQIKDGWIALLDKGGSDPSSVNVPGLVQAVEELGIFFDLSEAEAKRSKTQVQPSLKRAKTLASVSAGKAAATGSSESDVVQSFEFDGTAVVPSGVHAPKLEKLISNLRIMLDCENEELAGWRLVVHRRQWGVTMGSLDFFYYSPDGRKFLSQSEIAKAASALKNPTAKSSKEAVRRLPEDAPGHPMIPSFEMTVVPPTKHLPELFRAPPADQVETLASSIIELQQMSGPRVKISKLKGWSISLDKERKALYVHSSNAVYQLAGSRSVASPSAEYRSLFLKSWLTFDACRRISQVLVDYCGPVVTSTKLTLEEVMGRVVQRAERCPGLIIGPDGQHLDAEIVVPADSLNAGHYYFPALDKVTADFVIASYTEVLDTCNAQLDKKEPRSGAVLAPNEYIEAPFARDLRSLGKKRISLVEQALKADKAEVERRRMEEIKRQTRDANRDKDRAKVLYKRIEEDGSSYLPDDLLLIQGHSVDSMLRGIPDRTMQQAVTKFVTMMQPPKVAMPQPVFLPWDPLVFDVEDLLKVVPKDTVADLPGLGKPFTSALAPLLGPPPKVVHPKETEERAMLTGAVTESCSILELDPQTKELGDNFARMLAIWDGACQVCLLKGLDPDKVVGRFSSFRRAFVRDGASKTMVALLKLYAQSAAPLTYIVEDEDDEGGGPAPAAPAQAAQGAAAAAAAAAAAIITQTQSRTDASDGAGAYDLDMLWPPPEYLLDPCTFPMVLRAAVSFYIRTDPEDAVDEAFEMGEVKQLSDGRDAGEAVKELVVRPMDLEGVCDDVIRQLLLDPEAEVFFHPVEKSEFPDYYEKIRRPMDLGQVRRRIAEGHYHLSRRPTPDAYSPERHAAAVERLLQAQRAVVKEGKEHAEGDEDSDEEMNDGGEPITEEQKHRLTLNTVAEILSERRLGCKDKGHDCGECIYCLDKPKFGGYNVLKQMCVNKQDVQMNRKQAAKSKGHNAWKRRQAVIAKDEMIGHFDEEVFYATDSLGAGHEGIAADVRLVFRNCHTYNKGTMPIYRAATKLLRIFGQNYLSAVVARDPRYAAPRVFGFSMFAKEHRHAFKEEHALDDDGGAPARFRRGYPSLLAAAKHLDSGKDYSTVPLEARMVLAEWLVNCNIETAEQPMDPKEAKADTARELTRELADYFVGTDRFHRRFWCNPRFVKETGWVMVEDLKTGRWGFFDKPEQLDKLYDSLDVRGRRENQLKRRLGEQLAVSKAALVDSAAECKAAVPNVDQAAKELDKAIKEFDRLWPLQLDSKQAAEQSRKTMLAKAEAEFNLKEAERKKEFEAKKSKWQQSANEAGRPYYYHVDTRETTWKKPLELEAVWIQRYFVAPTQPTKEESESLALERKIAEAKALIAQRTIELEATKAVIVRERVVASLAVASKQSPQDRQQDWARDGVQARVARLCATILMIEHFSASEQANPVVAVGFEAWRRAAERPQWRTAVRQLVSKDTGVAPDQRVDVVIAGLVPLLEKLVVVLCEGPQPPAQNREMVRVQALVKSHQWRWLRTLRSCKSLDALALLVAQLKHMVILDRHSDAAASWLEETLKGFV